MVRAGLILGRVSRERDEKKGLTGLPGSHEKTVINRGNGISLGVTLWAVESYNIKTVYHEPGWKLEMEILNKTKQLTHKIQKFT